MTQQLALSVLHKPETITCYHYRGGNSAQRRKELRAYLRELAWAVNL